jgi:hypothetical protein
VEAIVHPDKRSNIPTADVQDFIGAEVETVQQLRWPHTSGVGHGSGPRAASAPEWPTLDSSALGDRGAH